MLRKFRGSEHKYLLISLLLFLVGMVILFIRNPHPVFNPIIYAEDGIWTGLGLSDGWVPALEHAKPEYFVWINILLLFISTKISSVLSGNPLSLLPQAIAIVSYGFYAAVATFAFITVKRVASVFFAVLGFLLILLLPLGVSQNEIVGRILQVGFYIPLLAIMLVFWRDRVNYRLTRFSIDFCLLLCAGTNPVVLALVLIYLSFDLSNDWNIWFSAKRTVTLTVPFAILAVCLLPRLGGTGPIPGGLVNANLIEAVLARPLLYPFSFPWYGSLTNSISVVLSFSLVCFFIFAYKKSLNIEAKLLILYSSIFFIVYDLSTILSRPGLTSILSNYQVTFPDRYFMGMNVLIVFLTVICIAQLLQVRRYRVISLGLTLLLLGVYASNFSHIFESNSSKLPLKGLFTFSEQMCLSETAGKGTGRSLIQVYPNLPKWRMEVPSDYIKKEGCEFKSYPDAGIARVGDEYKYQPSAPLSASVPLNIFMTLNHKKQSVGLKRVGIMFGTFSKQNLGEAELRLSGPDNAEFLQRFTLQDLPDFKYRFFDLDSKRYTEGKIVSLSGGGVILWGSRSEKDGAHSCVVYEYADGKRRFTPGCHLL